MGLSAPRILGGSIRLEKNDWTLGGPDEGKRLLSTSGDQPTCGFWCPRYPLSQSALKCPFQAETEKKKKKKKKATGSRRKEIKIRTEIDEKEMKGKITKISKTKNWLFDKIKLTDH